MDVTLTALGSFERARTTACPIHVRHIRHIRHIRQGNVYD